MLEIAKFVCGFWRDVSLKNLEGLNTENESYFRE